MDVREEEFLKLSYDIYTLPQTIFIKDGMAYEMQVLNIFYDNVRAFIEGNYQNETKVYWSGPVKTQLVNYLTVYYYYAYRDGLKYWNKVHYDIYEQWVQHYNLTENEQVVAFFKLDVK